MVRKLDKAIEIHGKLVQIKGELDKVKDEIMRHNVLDFGDRYDLVQAITMIDKVIDRLKRRIGEVLSWIEDRKYEEEGENEQRGDV